MDLLESMKRDIRITEYAQQRGFTLVRAGTQYSLKEHDSVRIDPDKNLFIRNADRQVRGSIIDFVMWVDGVEMPEAVRTLRGQMKYGHGYTPRPPRSQQPIERKPIELPKRTEGKFSRVYAYLNKTRCLSKAVIADVMKRKMLYEDERHNCVFVGFDYDNKPGYAGVRGTMTDLSYRGDVTGSRKEVGFFINNKARSLFVTEAPIDAMSIMSMLELNNRDPTKYNYLALCGTSENALLYHIGRPENANIERIYLATDNDEAGYKARINLRESLMKAGFQGEIINKIPKGKDWNLDLVQLVNPNLLQKQIPQKKPELKNTYPVQTSFERGMEL